MKKIAVFASGAGTNAAKIIEYFATTGKSDAAVVLVVCNKPGAGVLQIAAANDIPGLIIEKEKFFHGDAYAKELKAKGIDLIILAGFLWKIPVALIQAFPHRIINIHPALLPKFGGKGMFGRFVHQAVIDQQEKESGISIHYVDELYDHGNIIFQAVCPVLENDTAETLARRVSLLEHEHFPQQIHRLISGEQPF